MRASIKGKGILVSDERITPYCLNRISQDHMRGGCMCVCMCVRTYYVGMCVVVVVEDQLACGRLWSAVCELSHEGTSPSFAQSPGAFLRTASWQCEGPLFATSKRRIKSMAYLAPWGMFCVQP
jgi:hypothetical protein